MTDRKSQSQHPNFEQDEIRRPNIGVAAARAEWALLAEAEPEIFLKGMMFECRELVRGTADVLADPCHNDLHEEYFRFLRESGQLCARLAKSIVKLRQSEALDERRQRIVVEHIDRGFVRLHPREPRVPPAPVGEGDVVPAKNE